MSQVSILMTVFNGMPYLEPAVESILNQSLSQFEFIIVDDGSTDGTADYLAKLDDPRVKILTQENKGTAAAANYGLTLVDTPFVARMDADDVAVPDRLQKQLEFMFANPDVGIVGTQVAPAGESGVGKSLLLPTEHEEIFSAMMEGKHGLAHSSIMIRTSVLERVGGYWSLPLIDDWDMMLRVGEASKLANLDEVGLHYRVHAGSLNGSSMLRMHRHISYAIECASRRQTGSPAISYDEYTMGLAHRPIWERIGEATHVYAMTHYRLAVAEIHGSKRLVGYARLVWSAICSPPRTFQRIKRLLRGKKRNVKTPKQMVRVRQSAG